MIFNKMMEGKMPQLTLQDFVLGSTEDLEARGYQLQAALHRCVGEFRHNRLYPTLADTINVLAAIDHILEAKSTLDLGLPQRLVEVDVTHKRLVFESTTTPAANLASTVAFIEFFRPLLIKVIDEGKELYHFVDKNTQFETVGISPIYQEEGYLFVSEGTSTNLRLYKYENSIFTSATERYRSLKMTPLGSIAVSRKPQPTANLKLSLLEYYRDMPNPATYSSSTDLDFPFEHTILPFAKRKLIAELCSQQKIN